GTPYLLSLGMSRSLTSLVWLAGPVSGLVMQPLVGALSDRCTLRWGRRRPFMLAGSLAVVFSLFLIGWAKDIARLHLLDARTLIYDGRRQQSQLAVWIAVIAFYLVDFAVNAGKCAIRALVVDVLPPEKQERGNAWAGGMIGVGSVCGYFMGMVNLVELLPALGNSQMKVLCVLASLALLTAVGITCVAVTERRYTGSSIATLRQLMRTARQLPPSIQRVCNVQFFAWIGWFPFLFYSTTWVAELAGHGDLADRTPGEDRVGEAARAGSYAFLIYSIVSLVTACVLPVVVATGEHASTRMTKASGQASLVIGWLLNLPRVYTLGHLVFGLALLSTLLAHSVSAATVVIGACGISWAIMMWAPFALIGEIISSDSDDDDRAAVGDDDDARVPGPSGSAMDLDADADGRDALTLVDEDDLAEPPVQKRRLRDSAGEILGIHNVYVVLPQFLSTFTSSILFALFDARAAGSSHVEEAAGIADDDGGHSPMAIGWILRLGGLSVLVAAFLS
ncbi:major facilitator superfamily domain-containing protein, partial [Thamnocephalis sphaerospora]